MSVLLLLCACGGKKENTVAQQQEDVQAKKMMQGIWIDAEDEEPAFRVEGDSIFYPDSISMPVRFSIIGDSLVLNGVKTTTYKILKNTENIFEFNNNNGEPVKFVKSSNPKAYMHLFGHKTPSVLSINQNKLIKRDTIVTNGNERYRCYTQVNPSSYKVYRTSVNDDGVEVDNVYFDNSIHIAIFNGATRIYSHDFRKNDFAKYIPEETLVNCILSDMILEKADAAGVNYQVQLCVPDSPTTYILKLFVSYNSELKISDYE